MSQQTIKSHNNQKYQVDVGLEVIIHSEDLPESAITSNVVAIDTETMGLQRGRDRLCLVQLYFPQTTVMKTVHCVQVPLNATHASVLTKLLADSQIHKIFHFGRFDIGVLYNTFNVLTQNVYCTKIASKFARTNTEAHSLKALCSNLLGVNLSKEECGSYWGAEILDPKQLKYAAYDVLYLPEIKNKLQLTLEREGRHDLAKKFMDFLPTIVEADSRGWNEAVFTF